MDKQYYNADSLARAVREFELQYSLSSEQVFTSYAAGEDIDGLPRFEQHVWSSFYEDIMRLTAGQGVAQPDLMTRAGRALTCVG